MHFVFIIFSPMCSLVKLFSLWLGKISFFPKKDFVLKCSFACDLVQILDMCAAPGSKTAQLIEMLHADMDVPFPGKTHRFNTRSQSENSATSRRESLCNA